MIGWAPCAEHLSVAQNANLAMRENTLPNCIKAQTLLFNVTFQEAETAGLFSVPYRKLPEILSHFPVTLRDFACVFMASYGVAHEGKRFFERALITLTR
jgi:hypothetical protein